MTRAWSSWFCGRMRRSLVLVSSILLSSLSGIIYIFHIVYMMTASLESSEILGAISPFTEREASRAESRTCPHGYGRNLLAARHPARRAAGRTRPRRPRRDHAPRGAPASAERVRDGSLAATAEGGVDEHDARNVSDGSCHWSRWWLARQCPDQERRSRVTPGPRRRARREHASDVDPPGSPGFFGHGYPCNECRRVHRGGPFHRRPAQA